MTPADYIALAEVQALATFSAHTAMIALFLAWVAFARSARDKAARGAV